MTPEERAERAFDMALIVANMCPLPKQEWFRDGKRHIVRQTASAICAATAELESENAALKAEVERLKRVHGVLEGEDDNVR